MSDQVESVRLTDELGGEVAVSKSGHIYFNPEKMRYDAESFAACMMAMDRKGVPRKDANGEEFSIWGRACWMGMNGVTGN